MFTGRWWQYTPYTSLSITLLIICIQWTHSTSVSTVYVLNKSELKIGKLWFSYRDWEVWIKTMKNICYSLHKVMQAEYFTAVTDGRHNIKAKLRLVSIYTCSERAGRQSTWHGKGGKRLTAVAETNGADNLCWFKLKHCSA